MQILRGFPRVSVDSCSLYLYTFSVCCSWLSSHILCVQCSCTAQYCSINWPVLGVQCSVFSVQRSVSQLSSERFGRRHRIEFIIFSWRRWKVSYSIHVLAMCLGTQYSTSHAVTSRDISRVHGEFGVLLAIEATSLRNASDVQCKCSLTRNRNYYQNCFKCNEARNASHHCLGSAHLWGQFSEMCLLPSSGSSGTGDMHSLSLLTHAGESLTVSLQCICG